MKRILLILLCVTVLFPSLTKTGLLIWFKANQDFIASSLCINRNNKDRQDCKGCCVLSKKLHEVDEQDTKTTPSPKTEMEWVWFVPAAPVMPEAHTALLYFFNELQKQLPALRYLDEIFHPPCV